MIRVFSIIATSLVCSGLAAAATWVVSEPAQAAIAATEQVECTIAAAIAPVQSEFGFCVETCVADSALFSVLVERWRKARGVTSSTSETVLDESYQRIIALGPRAIPLVLRQMASEGEDPDQWFWALQMLTGVNPVSEEDEGNFSLMSKAWFKWASDAGYVW